MSRRYGVVVGVVQEREDPQREGRVRVSFPWLAGGGRGYWAPVATLMSGRERGSWFMPEIGDEVLVAFEQGDVNHPYVIGFLWNGEDRPPIDNPQTRLLRTVNGHEIELRDPDVAAGDQGGIRIEDAHGNVIELRNATITIRSVARLDIQAPTVTINGRIVAPSPSPI